MGCGSSASRDVKLTSHCQREEIAKQVRVERGCKATLRSDSNTVFVFGGPGSGKGRIVSQLLETCSSAELISTELLILDQLPHKVSNAIKLHSTKDVIDLLRSDPSHVSLQWVLSLVEQYIRHHDNSDHALYLVDLLPNLQCIVTNSNISQDCSIHLEQFEAQLPISFALYLDLCENDLHRSPHGGLLPQGATIGDEADNSRTKQRFLSYQKLVAPFLQYFKDNGCLVTVDVSNKNSSLVQGAVNELFLSDDMLAYQVHPVLVFAVGGMAAGNLDLSQVARGTVITLAPLVSNACSLEEELKILKHHLQTIGGGVDFVIINTDGTDLASQNANEFSKQAVMFHDVILNNSTPCQKLNNVAMTTYFKSFYSNGTTLLFPLTTNNQFCEIVSCYVTNN